MSLALLSRIDPGVLLLGYERAGREELRSLPAPVLHAFSFRCMLSAAVSLTPGFGSVDLPLRFPFPPRFRSLNPSAAWPSRAAGNA